MHKKSEKIPKSSQIHPKCDFLSEKEIGFELTYNIQNLLIYN